MLLVNTKVQMWALEDLFTEKTRVGPKTASPKGGKAALFFKFGSTLLPVAEG